MPLEQQCLGGLGAQRVLDQGWGAEAVRQKRRHERLQILPKDLCFFVFRYEGSKLILFVGRIIRLTFSISAAS
ncbi:hypothetical protein DU80_15010 [Methanosarcina mazei]|uniref:Uncharacterized protein n=1 Tax=Methanosarcina mazei TaxID=2209 RepID=A0A0F8RC05_METMZ|nr:hypothetical protein DU48_17795 [Methanosarcina mazei]KKH42652.1 hypothetical protein DU54_15625 [Methanosarcina mazei]KKH54267.1 hypothetical protein DU76_15520 [Methanosarcina mazei]KKH59677.1 hypothetical protein DU73_08340 [Methanosarcina mazei]KKH75010.1 hypothetical protein DU86_01590 [Methanosarcina mazei]